MKKTLVLTLIGEDRPGLVELVSQQIADHQGHWLDSQFSHLEGKFAGILRISVPETSAENLGTALRGLVDQGLRVMIEEGQQGSVDPSYPLSLRFVGLDRRGVVAEISEVLKKYAVSILSLKSHCAPAPMGGEILFHADFDVRVPVSVSCERLSEALESLSPDLLVDLDEPEAQAV